MIGFSAPSDIGRMVCAVLCDSDGWSVPHVAEPNAPARVTSHVRLSSSYDVGLVRLPASQDQIASVLAEQVLAGVTLYDYCSFAENNSKRVVRPWIDMGEDNTDGLAWMTRSAISQDGSIDDASAIASHRQNPEWLLLINRWAGEIAEWANSDAARVVSEGRAP